MLHIILPPLFGGVIGYITNDIAIRMLFRPHTEKHLFGVRLPFTPGIIPKEKGRIAKAMGDAISENLMNKDVLEKTLLSDDITCKITQSIDTFCERQRKNHETLWAFIQHYLSDSDIEKLVGSASSEFKKVLSEKLAKSNFGQDIANMAIKHAMEKVTGGVLGVFGADKLLGPVAAIAEPLLAKEINSMIRDNSTEMIDRLVNEQSNDFVNTPMWCFFADHEEQISQVKDTVLSLYHTLVLEHLPKILTALNLSQMIEQRINEMDMNEIEPIILQVMDKELKAVVWFGAGLGALIGCINIFL